ncbi:MAG: DUF3347 domain-containing protein [Chitinophagaceae bacterium]
MKVVLGILGIVLPAFIIILGIVRIFVAKTKGVNGLTMFFAILLLLTGLIRYFFYPGESNSHNSGPKTAPVGVSSHSQAFNQSLETLLNAYYKMKEGFVVADTVVINSAAADLQSALDSLRITELQVDSLIYQTALQPYSNARTEIRSILTDPSIIEKRNSLNIFSNELRDLVSIVRYDRATVYWLECANAFGEDRPGNWLSMAEKSGNPYGQPECAEVKSSINFVTADTTKKQ